MQRAIERENEDIHHRSSQYSFVKRFVYLGPEYQWAKKGMHPQVGIFSFVVLSVEKSCVLFSFPVLSYEWKIQQNLAG